MSKIKLPAKVESMEDVKTLLLSGSVGHWEKYGKVKVTTEGDLSLFNYTHEAMFDGEWNFFEQACRGLIINNKTGEIVARPFDKFFNWMQHGKKSQGHMKTITEKVDGSMGTLYRVNGKYKIATRGSFNSDQAIVATDMLHDAYGIKHLDSRLVPDELTLIFEIVFPSNRIVVDYGNREELVLLAARNRHTGDYLPFFPGHSLSVYEIGQELGFGLPKTHAFNNITEIIEKTGFLPGSDEGYVVEFSDGQRFKFKGDKYMELHKLLSGLSYKNTVMSVRNKDNDYIRSQIPDEFWTEFDGWVGDIKKRVSARFVEVFRAWDNRPKFDTRKDFALWAVGKHKLLSSALFMMYDDEHENFIDGKNSKLNAWVWRSTFEGDKNTPVITRVGAESE